MKESPKTAEVLLPQTRQGSYSAQPPQKRAYTIFIAAGRKYCQAGIYHPLISLSLLQKGCNAILAGATLSHHFMLADAKASANWQILVTSVLHMLPMQYGTVSLTANDIRDSDPHAANVIWDSVPHAANIIWDCISQSSANSICCLLQHLQFP